MLELFDVKGFFVAVLSDGRHGEWRGLQTMLFVSALRESEGHRLSLHFRDKVIGIEISGSFQQTGFTGGGAQLGFGVWSELFFPDRTFYIQPAGQRVSVERVTVG